MGDVTAFVLALLAALAVGILAPVATPKDCRPTPVDTVPQATVDTLIAVGWQGDPTDGMEALYAPGCVTGP